MIAVHRFSGTVTVLHPEDVEGADGSTFTSGHALAKWVLDHPEGRMTYRTGLVLVGVSEHEWEDERSDERECTYHLRCAAIEGIAVLDDE